MGSGSHGSTPTKPGTSTTPTKPGTSTTPTKPGDNGSTTTGGSVSNGGGESQKQVDSPRMSTLASTGANVIGVFAVGLALIIGAIPLLRHRRRDGEA